MPIHRKYDPKTSQCIKLNDIIWINDIIKFKVFSPTDILWNEDLLHRVVSNSSCNLENYLGFLVKEEKTNLDIFLGFFGYSLERKESIFIVKEILYSLSTKESELSLYK